jgi:hypothetical protein
LSKTANSLEWQDRAILWVDATFAQSFSGEPSTDRAGSVDAAVALDEGQGVQEIGNLLGIRANKANGRVSLDRRWLVRLPVVDCPSASASSGLMVSICKPSMASARRASANLMPVMISPSVPRFEPTSATDPSTAAIPITSADALNQKKLTSSRARPT